MDILLQLQSARKKKTFYFCVENLPVNTLSRALLELNFLSETLRTLPLIEEKLNDNFYVAGIIDKSFCNRKVTLTVSYDDFYRQACGLGEASSIV
nr:MAG TPA: hypothetical protein [Microviridae sp.]